MAKDDTADTARIQVPPSGGSPAPAGNDDLYDRRTVRLAVPPSMNNPEAPSMPAALPLGGTYAILEKIGDGGMGVVYLARDRTLGRYVAIKRLNRKALSDPSLRKRFFREAEAIAALHHEHIVHVFALSEDQEGPYIVMEYVPGPPEASPGKDPPRPITLADRVHRSGPLPVGEMLGLMLKVCAAMEYAHGRGVIHRDLKPSNILLDGNGEPKIVDFGLAHKSLDAGGVPLTVPGEKMLSLGYGAPEQERDATRTDQRTDVYGLGGLLYFGLTSQNPRFFREKDVPEALRVPIVKALEPDRDKRWSSVAEFAEALSAVHAPSAVELPSVKTTWRCKWCDTVNPVAIQFCGRCGWNGGEICAECGTQTRVGVQFCGVCGADAREYERALVLHKTLQEHWDRKDFEFVERHAGQITGFLPVGTNGRALAVRIQKLQEDARHAIERRRSIRVLIDREFRNENYERAQQLIAEFRTLSDEALVYDDMIRDLPGLIASRDVNRAREALRRGRLDYARRICEDVLRHVAPANREAGSVLRLVAWRRGLRRAIRVLSTVLAVLLVYLLSAAPVFRLMDARDHDIFRTVFWPVELVREATFLRVAISRYAEWWGARGMFDVLSGYPHGQALQPARARRAGSAP